jgi:hypothetical protein
MRRRSRQRIETAEELAAVAVSERDEKEKQWVEAKRVQARHHATAVAAILLAGQPRIDDPLEEAWVRAARHYDFDAGRYPRRVPDRLFPEIVGDVEEEVERFTQIFRRAPVWLLLFTSMGMDAHFLKFRLPSLKATLKWGNEGLEELFRWPALPFGTMTAGDRVRMCGPKRPWPLLPGEPITGVHDGQVCLALCQSTDPIPQFEYPKPDDPIDEELEFVLALAARPESEWSHYERRRMRRLSRDPDLASIFALVRVLRELPLPAFLPKSAVDEAGLLPATALGRLGRAADASAKT